MISFFTKHKRLFSLLSLVALSGIAAAVLLEHNIEFSGGAFLLGSFFTLLYLVISSYLLSKKNDVSKSIFHTREVWYISIILGVLLLVATVESANIATVFTIIFGELFLLLVVFSYYQFTTESQSDRAHQSPNTKRLPTWSYWAFFIVNGILIVVLEDSFADKEQFGIAILTFFSVCVIFTIGWIFKQIKTIIKLQQIQKTTELKHLQNQVNPHFFFNMLNNLYGWVEKDSKVAQKMILQLSDMMRYSIYDGQEEYVKIEQEVSYLKNFTDLHLNRYQKDVDVRFDVNIDDPDININPLLLIILIENAFKHGVEKLRDEAFVHISLKVDQKSLELSVKNNFDPESIEESTGIGLQNLRRRLSLAYPDRFTLTSSRNEQTYNAQLRLQIS